ncbi:MAG: VWA domain-containing protein [Acidobacteria bacterium]|nr:VWA domain-containing protein [Acidobacteriota bacterium]
MTLSKTLLCLCLLSCLPVYPLQSPQRETVAKVAVNEVLLDVVVTDGKGKQARGLASADFAVYEDGVLQTLTAVREVSKPSAGPAEKETSSKVPAVAPERGEAAARRTPIPQFNVISLVFDRISPSGRKIAGEAALDFVRNLGSNDFASVVVIDRVLRVIAPFTQDAARLDAAVRLATGGTPQQFVQASKEVFASTREAEVSTESAQSAAADMGPANSSTTAMGSAFANAAFNQATSIMLSQSTTADDTIQGLATVDALMGVIRGDRTLPGRKAVLYFAERIALPPVVMGRFRDLISAANRANVSFYCVDTTGLESAGQMESMAGELSRLASVGKRQLMKRPGEAVRRDEVMLAEDGDNVISMVRQNNLMDLAESTGGNLIANTNDLTRGLRQVSEDLQYHYELSYVPTNSVYDGSYRRIELKIRRPGLVARSRAGYYALGSDEFAESPYELPLFEALNSGKAHRDLAMRTTTLLFPAEGVRSSVMLYIETPLSDFLFSVDKKKKEYSARIQVLVVVRNAAGRIVRKFSQEFPFQGVEARAAETRQRNFIFYRTTDLVPGRYTVETVVRDPLSDRSSLKRSVVVVPPRPPKSLALSSVVLVKRLDDTRPEPLVTDSPLAFGKQLVVPNLDSEISLEEWSGLAFYFVASLPSAFGASVDAVISREGQPVAHMGERPLPPADNSGTVRYLTTLPLETLTEGNYDVEVVVRQGDTAARSRIPFVLK